MSEKLEINIQISGRLYPVSVNSTEEEGMRKAASKINKLISLYERDYAVNDKQDVLAMCAFRFASQLEISSLEGKTDKVLKKVNELNKMLDNHLE